MKLIGITGKAGSGKDTIANYLRLEHGFIQYAFATPIKRAIATMLDMEIKELFSRTAKEEIIDFIGKSPRFLAQTLGTEWGRDLVHKDIWVILAKRFYDIQSVDPYIKGIVIADVRFDNEAEWIKSEGGIIIEVSRSYVLPCYGEHSSESGIKSDFIDIMIVNDSDIETLYSNIEHKLRFFLTSTNGINEEAKANQT